MTVSLAPSPEVRTLADLLDRLGGIPAERVRYHPLPGTATEADVIAIDAHEDRLCELIDGVLVEKPMGYQESLIALCIATALNAFVRSRRLGAVSGEQGMMRLFPGTVRIPDVAFVSRSRLPGGKIPSEPIPPLVPDLAVEVLSESNTPREMERKLREYFEAGVRVVWIVDPRSRTATVHTSTSDSVGLQVGDAFDGGEVLPGFRLELQEIFAILDE
jgi:Uma2 family endonuclease